MTLAEKAAALADLMTLSAEIGSAARIEEDGGVSLVDPSQDEPRRIGASVAEAVRHLRRIVEPSAIPGGHHGAPD